MYMSICMYVYVCVCVHPNMYSRPQPHFFLPRGIRDPGCYTLVLGPSFDACALCVSFTYKCVCMCVYCVNVKCVKTSFVGQWGKCCGCGEEDYNEAYCTRTNVYLFFKLSQVVKIKFSRILFLASFTPLMDYVYVYLELSHGNIYFALVGKITLTFRILTELCSKRQPIIIEHIRGGSKQLTSLFLIPRSRDPFSL